MQSPSQSDGSIIVAGFDYLSPGESHPLLMRFSGASNAPAAAASSTTTATDAALMFMVAEDPALTTKRK